MPVLDVVASKCSYRCSCCGRLILCWRTLAALNALVHLCEVSASACAAFWLPASARRRGRYRSKGQGQNCLPNYCQWQTGQRKRRPLSEHLPLWSPLTRKSARSIPRQPVENNTWLTLLLASALKRLLKSHKCSHRSARIVLERSLARRLVVGVCFTPAVRDEAKPLFPH